MSIELAIDELRLKEVKEGLISELLIAATDATHAATLKLQREIEVITRTVVPGNAWRAWKSAVFPKAGQASYNPVGTIFVNGGTRGRGMMAYSTQPGENRAKDGFWLAIPLPSAGQQTRGRMLTPGEWERRTGMRLQFVYRKGKSYSLLVAEGTAAKNGSGALRKMTARRGAQGRGSETVPIFVLIPFQRFANRLSLEAPIQRAGSDLASGFRQRVAALGAR